ncbi:MAG: TolC family protein [Chlamydiae bacterium]|nr:TolC family protein [Chlamydiota bacterium]
MSRLILPILFFCGLFLVGCSVRSSDSSFEAVRSAIEERISEKIVWREGTYEIKNQLLQEVQQGGLTQEKAVQLALLNNPDLFAYYENLELGYADLLEAGLVQNPFFSASVRFPSQSSYHVNNLFDAAINFLDFFLIPLRKKAAEADIKVIEAEVGQRVLNLVKEVQIYWLELQTIETQLKEEKKRASLKQMTAALAELQYKAGNISALSARSHEIAYETAMESLKSLEADLETKREKMNRALGLLGKEATWEITGEIDEKKEPDLPDLYQLERAAIDNRLDVEVLRREIYAIAQKAKLKAWWTYSNLLIGVSSEVQPEGFTTTGPSIDLQVPIFNHGQGEKKRYNAKLEQAQKRLLSKAVQACSEVREFFRTARKYKSQLEDLEVRILPHLKQQIVAGQIHYNVMTLGSYALFDLKETEIQAKIEHIQALQRYKKARIELLHAVGGSFTLVRKQE